jgi:hypothetical protein
MFDIKPSNSRRLRRKPLYLVLLALFAISTVFAASTSLTQGTSIEFGQGVFQVKVCDTWVGVNLKTILEPNGYQGGSGGYYVNQIQIIGLDSTACSGSNLQLSFYTTGNANPLPLYVGASTSPTNVTMAVNTSYYATRKGQVELITPAGVITRNDSYERITPDYDANSNFDGIYNINFTTPLALGTAVNTITLQSTAQ